MSPSEQAILDDLDEDINKGLENLDLDTIDTSGININDEEDLLSDWLFFISIYIFIEVCFEYNTREVITISWPTR